jgi:hypothetical protein
MRYTIAATENKVLVDGVAIDGIDCSALPPIRVVQWDTEKAKGWLEFSRDENDNFVLNQDIDDFTPYQPYIDEWMRLKAEMDAEAIVTPVKKRRRAKR